MFSFVSWRPCSSPARRRRPGRCAAPGPRPRALPHATLRSPPLDPVLSPAPHSWPFKPSAQGFHAAGALGTNSPHPPPLPPPLTSARSAPPAPGSARLGSGRQVGVGHACRLFPELGRWGAMEVTPCLRPFPPDHFLPPRSARLCSGQQIGESGSDRACLPAFPGGSRSRGPPRLSLPGTLS